MFGNGFVFGLTNDNMTEVAIFPWGPHWCFNHEPKILLQHKHKNIIKLLQATKCQQILQSCIYLAT